MNRIKTIHGLRLSQAKKIAQYEFGKDFISIKQKSNFYYVYIKKSADPYTITKMGSTMHKNIFRIVVDKKKVKKNKFEFKGEPFLKS